MAARIVVLASGQGTLLQALIEAEGTGRLKGRIVAVGSDRPSAPALDRAARAAIETFCLPFPAAGDRGDSGARSLSRSRWDAELAARLTDLAPDLVVLAGFMRLLGPAVLSALGGRIINAHPSLLPAFPGAHAVADTLAAGITTSGSTIIAVDAGIDTGRVLAQRQVPVLPGDDELSLHERIKVVERELLVDTVNAVLGVPAGDAEITVTSQS